MLYELVAFSVVLFFPGWTLVNFLFPRKGELDREYDALYRVTLGIVMSIAIVVLLGFVFNFASPASGPGLFTGPNLWTSLTAFTFAFFVAGWWRGAYPVLGRVHPILRRPAPREASSILGDLDVDRQTLGKFRELATERLRWRRVVKDAERRSRLHTGTMRTHYEEKLREAQRKLHEVDVALTKLEEERAADLY